MPDPTADASADLTAPRTRSTLRRLLRGAYLVAVVVALVVAVADRRTELADQLSRSELGPLLLALVAALVGVGVSGLIWRRVLAGLGSPLPLRPAATVFFVAQVGKYLPGSLWPVLAQAELGRDHDVPGRTAVAAQTLFMWVHLVTGAIIGVPVLAVVGVIPEWLAPTALIGVALLVPAPLVGVMDRLLVRLGRRPLPGRPSGADMAVASGWAVVMWLLYGAHTYWLVDALEFTAGPVEAIVATGAFAAAWSAGFLFLIAPAGAGAREVVLVVALSTVAAPETAFTVALLSRVQMTVADAAWALAGGAAGLRRGGASDPIRRSEGVQPRAQRRPRQGGGDVGDGADL